MVTRVAVTVRTKTFFTRTKIRKLAVAGHRCGCHHADGTASFSISSNSTARCGCSGVRLELALAHAGRATDSQWR